MAISLIKAPYIRNLPLVKNTIQKKPGEGGALSPLERDVFQKTTNGASEKIKLETLSLERNPLWECDIPYNENNYYRMIGKSGYEDFLSTGLIRAKQDTKQNYSVAYFEKGHANAIYAKKGGAEYIVETDDSKITTKKGAYPYSKGLNKDEDNIRIYKRTDNKGRHYELVFDSFKLNN